MIGYDPLHTDTKLDFIHSLIHTLIHLFTLSLGGPLTVCLLIFHFFFILTGFERGSIYTKGAPTLHSIVKMVDQLVDVIKIQLLCQSSKPESQRLDSSMTYNRPTRVHPAQLGYTYVTMIYPPPITQPCVICVSHGFI